MVWPQSSKSVSCSGATCVKRILKNIGRIPVAATFITRPIGLGKSIRGFQSTRVLPSNMTSLDPLVGTNKVPKNIKGGLPFRTNGQAGAFERAANAFLPPRSEHIGVQGIIDAATILASKEDTTQLGAITGSPLTVWLVNWEIKVSATAEASSSNIMIASSTMDGYCWRSLVVV